MQGKSFKHTQGLSGLPAGVDQNGPRVKQLLADVHLFLEPDKQCKDYCWYHILAEKRTCAGQHRQNLLNKCPNMKKEHLSSLGPFFFLFLLPFFTCTVQPTCSRIKCMVLISCVHGIGFEKLLCYKFLCFDKTQYHFVPYNVFWIAVHSWEAPYVTHTWPYKSHI